jgi:hypothetical protein
MRMIKSRITRGHGVRNTSETVDGKLKGGDLGISTCGWENRY